MQYWRQFVGSNVPGYRKRKQDARGNAILGLLFGFFVAYIASEAVLGLFPHPLHWLSAGVAAFVIYMVTFIWLLRRSYARHTYKRPRQ